MAFQIGLDLPPPLASLKVGYTYIHMPVYVFKMYLYANTAPASIHTHIVGLKQVYKALDSKIKKN